MIKYAEALAQIDALNLRETTKEKFQFKNTEKVFNYDRQILAGRIVPKWRSAASSSEYVS